MSEYVIVPARGRRGEFREMIDRCTRHGRRGHHGHGRGMRGYQGRAGRGDIRAAILALLAEQPMHGYQIMRELRDRSGGSPTRVCPTRSTSLSSTPSGRSPSVVVLATSVVPCFGGIGFPPAVWRRSPRRPAIASDRSSPRIRPATRNRRHRAATRRDRAR